MGAKLIFLLIAVILLAGTASLGSAQGFTTWTDPNGKFTIGVPQGWRASGSSYTDNTGTSCYYVVTMSPDGSMGIMLGDPRLAGTYISYQIPYMTGKEFVERYYESYIATSMQGLQVVGDQDLGNGAGVVMYTDGNNIGLIAAQTANGGSMWQLQLLLHMIAPANQAYNVLAVATQMAQSVNFGGYGMTGSSRMVGSTMGGSPSMGSMASMPNFQQYAQQQMALNNQMTDIALTIGQNAANAREHGANMFDAYIRDDYSAGNQYQWETPSGQTLFTDSYVNPTGDSNLEY